MFETKLEIPTVGDAAAADRPDAQGGAVGAPCNWDPGHTGQCHCSNGHYWGNGC